jgi:hypothetical protein
MRTVEDRVVQRNFLVKEPAGLVNAASHSDAIRCVPAFLLSSHSANRFVLQRPPVPYKPSRMSNATWRLPSNIVPLRLSSRWPAGLLTTASTSSSHSPSSSRVFLHQCTQFQSPASSSLRPLRYSRRIPIVLDGARSRPLPPVYLSFPPPPSIVAQLDFGMINPESPRPSSLRADNSPRSFRPRTDIRRAESESPWASSVRLGSGFLGNLRVTARSRSIALWAVRRRVWARYSAIYLCCSLHPRRTGTSSIRSLPPSRTTTLR